MYSQLSTRLVLDDTAHQFSPALALEGNNAVQLDATVFVNTATSLTIAVQQSNEMQNWSDHTETTGFVVGYKTAKITGIASSYVRLRYTVVGTGTIIVAAGLNTSSQ